MASDAPLAVAEDGRGGADDCDARVEEEEVLATFPDTECGLWKWHPPWLQRFASKKMFVLVLGLLGLSTQSVGAYANATLSTLEKRFKIPSQTSGIISCFWDVGEITSLLAMGYFGARKHKPRLLAISALLMAASCFLRLLIHVAYGPGSDALALTKEFGNLSSVLSTNDTGETGGGVRCGNANETAEEDCNTGEGSFSVPTLLLILSTWFFGISTSTYFTLGLTYIDDNSSKEKSPLAIAVSLCIRLVGPTLGFGFGTYALAVYVVPSATPLIGNDDPRWIGAWWMGWAPAAALLVLCAALMLPFPKRLPREALRRARAGLGAAPSALAPASFQDFRATLTRLFRNPVFTLNSLSGVFFAVGFVGYGLFMPKYMETQYRQSASTASFISGAVGLVCTGLGILASGAAVSRWRPSARALALWSVCVEVVDVVGHLSWAFLTCGEDDLHGAAAADGSWDLAAPCNAHCGCAPHVKYEPVCSVAAATTFYSPCHAGCGVATAFANGTMLYADCACSPDGLVQAGPCPRDCSLNFALFLATQCAMRFLEASGLAGNLLIQFRCVEEKDKAMSMALSEFVLCGIGFIPGPILYGLLMDSTCLVWGVRCGGTGNCWFYDDRKLRYHLNFSAAACLFVGLVLDIGVWYYSKNLKIYDEDDAEGSSKHKRKDNRDIFMSTM